jgi:hypothetical protein
MGLEFGDRIIHSLFAPYIITTVMMHSLSVERPRPWFSVRTILYLVVALSWSTNVFASEDIFVALNQTLQAMSSEVAHMQRELFFSHQGNIVACIKRELGDFNDMFDAIAYRDMIMAEAGITVEGLREKYSWRDRNRFDGTPEHASIMEVLAKRKAELEEVAQIVEACHEEVEGGRSAVGAGAMVGTLLALAMEAPIDRALTTNGEQTSEAPTISMAPSLTPTNYPTYRPYTKFHLVLLDLIQASLYL